MTILADGTANALCRLALLKPNSTVKTISPKTDEEPNKMEVLDEICF